MHISQVHLKNYKNYHDCKVELSEGLNVIVGPNNTGKSNLLDAIEFIFHKPDKNIDDFNKYDLYKNLEYYKLNVPSISFFTSLENVIVTSLVYILYLYLLFGQVEFYYLSQILLRYQFFRYFL